MSFLYVCVCALGGFVQLCETVRPLSLSDVIITAASLKPLSFLPGDSPQLPYPQTGPLTHICRSMRLPVSAENTL